MKNGLSLIALAAGFSQVMATYPFGGFHNAPTYPSPDNTDNQCKDDIKGGLDWKDLNFGDFSKYKGFDYSGFKCGEKFGKRDVLSKRTFQSKCITGTAQKDKNSSPKISCDKSAGVEKTSIKEFQVTPDFDTDLEFHYTMPDGSSCKHRSSCKSAGTVVKNTQCGGATDVTIVYPTQPKDKNPGKNSCGFGIHHVDFDCEPPKPPKPTPNYPTYPTYTPSETPEAPSSSTPVETPSETPVETPSSTPIAPSSFPPVTVPVPTFSYPIGSPSETPSIPAETPSVPAATPSAPAETPSIPAETPSVPVESSSSTAPVETPSVTSYITTSTIFSTSITTITSCGPEVPDCPAGSATVTTVVIPVSTTICPVTETLSASVPAAPPAESPSVPAAPPAESPSVPAAPPAESPSVPAAPPAESSSIPAAPPAESPSVPAEVPSSPAASSTLAVPSSPAAPAGPLETLPCPAVVPSCMNTWIPSVGCKDNTDSSCFCPDSAFVDNVFACLYAHGESDAVISEATSYFQGICAPFVPTNPGIATGAETYTTVLTATPTAYPTAVTTIMVTATAVVPCTNEVGETIPSSSSTVTITTVMTVPEVTFTTITAGVDSSSVAIVPGTYSATLPIATATATAPAGGASPPFPTASGAVTTFTTAPSAGFPGASASPSPTFATAGAAHVAGTGFGFLGMLAVAMAAL